LKESPCAKHFMQSQASAKKISHRN
jgi:hypothetical protein